ncbi:MAG: YceI family protein [Segetibacter sp.]|nr:YceI family protein [Segetibacter sp.]
MKKFFTASLVMAAIVVATSAFTPSKQKSASKKNEAIEVIADQAGKWVIDKPHSNIKFTVTHLVVSEVEGSFKIFDGSMENTKADFSDARINFSVDVNSLSTDNDMRDKHLKSDDFFNAEKYPAMKFESTSFTPAGGNKYKLAGNLTIRDVTKPVVFDVTYGGTVTTMGKTKLGFKAKTAIDRFDYNLKWNKATEAGGLVVSKEVELVVNVELNKA